MVTSGVNPRRFDALRTDYALHALRAAAQPVPDCSPLCKPSVAWATEFLARFDALRARLLRCAGDSSRGQLRTPHAGWAQHAGAVANDPPLLRRREQEELDTRHPLRGGPTPGGASAAASTARPAGEEPGSPSELAPELAALQGVDAAGVARRLEGLVGRVVESGGLDPADARRLYALAARCALVQRAPRVKGLQAPGP